MKKFARVFYTSGQEETYPLKDDSDGLTVNQNQYIIYDTEDVSTGAIIATVTPKIIAQIPIYVVRKVLILEEGTR
jgi:hypothetical protein